MSVVRQPRESTWNANTMRKKIISLLFLCISYILKETLELISSSVEAISYDDLSEAFFR